VSENLGRRAADVPRQERAGARTGSLRTLVGHLDDAVLLLVVVLMVPVVILLIGTPVALFVRLVLEITKRL
jgi:hypothetical protein